MEHLSPSALATATAPTNMTAYLEPDFVRGATLLAVAVFAVPVDILILFAIPMLNKWTTSDTLVMGLTVADLGTCVTAVPMAVYAYFSGHRYDVNSAECYACAFFITMPRFAAMFIVTAIAIDRYVAMKKPFWHRSTVALRPKVMKRVVILLYILASALAALPFIGADEVRVYSHDYYCFYEMDGWYNILITILGYGQLVIVLVCFIFVLKCISSIVEKRRTLTRPSFQAESIRKAMNMGSPKYVPPRERVLKRGGSLGLRSNNAEQTTDMFHVERQFAKMFAILVLLFYACWLPMVVIGTILEVQHEQRDDLNIWGMRLAVANCAVNPIIYTLMRPQYRQMFRHLFKRMFSACGCTMKPAREELELIRRGSMLTRTRGGSVLSIKTGRSQGSIRSNISLARVAAMNSLPFNVNEAGMTRQTSLSSIIEEDQSKSAEYRSRISLNRGSKDSSRLETWRENIEIAEEAIRSSMVVSQSEGDSLVSVSINMDNSTGEPPEVSRGTDSSDSVLGK